METGLIILIVGIILLVPPMIINRIIGLAMTIIGFIVIISAQNIIIDAGIDAAIDIAEDLNLVNIPDTFCPEKFNRTEYCIQFGLDKGTLTGHAFLNHEISNTIDLKFETKEKLLTCKLTRDNMCNFAEIKSAKDLKITLTDKYGATILSYKELSREVKLASKSIGIVSLIKRIKIK